MDTGAKGDLSGDQWIARQNRLAERAGRERDAIGKCAFLAAHVGEVHEGRITGVARHGAYVTLDEWYVEGLVHVSRLPGYFVPDALGFALVSAESRLRFALGDRLRVQIARADPVEAKIDLEWLERLDP